VTVSPAISVDRLVVRRGDRRVLDELSFQVFPGEIVGLLGPNGAGKTTTLAVLGTLLRADSGDVAIAGHDARTNVRAARRAIGRVPQDVAVYPTLTARENTLFFARLAGMRARDAARAAAEALELVGLTSRADDAAGTYSSGMQRRLNLACGLLGKPPVLLLDEPTVGVDPQSLERIVVALRGQAAAGSALLYSTHHMEEAAQLCDRVVLIDEGRVLAHGAPDELMARAQPGLRVDVVTVEPLPSAWLDGLDGARLLETESEAGKTLQRVAIEHLDLAARVLERAERHGQLIELHVQRPTLHDAFLALTGRALRD
jgi:linearmycin/streptolysin S transport system ATP-binding protein